MLLEGLQALSQSLVCLWTVAGNQSNHGKTVKMKYIHLKQKNNILDMTFQAPGS